MALVLNLSNKQNIEVIPFVDECLEMSREEYEEYLNDVSNVSLLTFKDGKTLEDCTKFILRKVLSFDNQQSIMARQMKMSFNNKTKENEMTSDISYVLEEARISISDIVSPDQLDALRFKKDSDGYLNKGICAALASSGILMDLYTARQASLSLKDDNLKKN